VRETRLDASTGQPVRCVPLIVEPCEPMPKPEPTDRELEALKVLWRRKEATVRDVWNALSSTDRGLAYTTVLSLMQVMEQKGLVEHRAEGKTYVFFPRVERASVMGRLASGFLEKVFDGAVDEYLVHALQSRRPSDEELDRLERMVVEAKARAKRKRKTSHSGAEKISRK